MLNISVKKSECSLGGYFLSGDLHCHTRLSNGSLSIDEMIALAKSKGVETIAITDHDCLTGTVRAKLIGERNGIKVITGAEISAIDPETKEIVHILCYLPEFPDRLEEICHHNSTVRKRACQYMMLKASQRYPITPDLIKRCATGATNLFPQHFMQALTEIGAADGFYGKVYEELFSPESEKNIITKPAFKDAVTVIEAIHTANGIAVLAHPAKYGGVETCERYLQYGIDGIEVWHPSANKETADALAAFAKNNKILATGGSSFHGLYNKDTITIGSYCTPKAQLQELLGYKAKQKRLQKKLSTQNTEE